MTTETGKTVLTVESVRKRYAEEGAWAVDGVSLALRSGEIVSIVGPNGAGKSTLIQMMLGLLVPDSGFIRLFGIDMVRNRRRVAHRINYASTDLSLPYSLTVRENLLAYALIYNQRNIRDKVDLLLSEMNLEGVQNVRVGRLSTGQIARMGIAKALINDPEILFLDEPTATLDPEVSSQLRTYLQGKVRERGMTLLYTSHNMREVERFSDRLYLMNRGKLVAEGRVADLMDRFRTDDLEALFMQMVNVGLEEHV
ncbi:MAG: ABC transporter ATP-binding protein [Nitrospirota bacterium]|nr:ABC transporter ATP-binding protein [Nitrospirota bacterium]